MDVRCQLDPKSMLTGIIISITSSVKWKWPRNKHRGTNLKLDAWLRNYALHLFENCGKLLLSRFDEEDSSFFVMSWVRLFISGWFIWRESLLCWVKFVSILCCSWNRSFFAPSLAPNFITKRYAQCPFYGLSASWLSVVNGENEMKSFMIEYLC